MNDIRRIYRNLLINKTNRINLNTNIFLFILAIFVFALPLYFNESLGRFTSDYLGHLKLAEKIIETKTLSVPHFLYHLLIIITSSLIPKITLKIAGYYIVPLFSYAFLGIIIYNIITEVIGKPKSYRHSVFIVIMALSLMIVAPINFLTWPNLYFGYIGINVYHNPTITLVKPLSLLSFFYITKILRNDCKLSFSRTINIKLFTITTLALIAKPSYFICLLPSLFIYICYFLYKNKQINWSIIFSVVVPTVTILLWQYSFTYGANQVLQEKSSIALAPFVVMNHLSNFAKSNFYYLNIFQKFALSAAFPTFVYILYFKEVTRNLRLTFAWVNFAFSAFYTYYLAETGRRIYDGNFGWSAQISLFILFVISSIFMVSKVKTNNIDFRFLVCTFIFILHLISGLLFYIYPNAW